jgi:hypothetical protein
MAEVGLRYSDRKEGNDEIKSEEMRVTILRKETKGKKQRVARGDSSAERRNAKTKKPAVLDPWVLLVSNRRIQHSKPWVPRRLHRHFMRTVACLVLPQSVADLAWSAGAQNARFWDEQKQTDSRMPVVM